jgi:hypothetical protein
MIMSVLATMALVLPVSDMKGHRIDECGVRPSDGGVLTLTCAGQEPMVLDYRLGSKEAYPKFRVERTPEGRVVKVEIRPARELDWRPVAWVALTIGAVFAGGRVWTDQEADREQPISPSKPGR